jgi:hypothetical protein
MILQNEVNRQPVKRLCLASVNILYLKNSYTETMHRKHSGSFGHEAPFEIVFATM